MREIQKQKPSKIKDKLHYVAMKESELKNIDLVREGLKKRNYTNVTRTSLIRLLIKNLELNSVLSMLET